MDTDDTMTDAADASAATEAADNAIETTEEVNPFDFDFDASGAEGESTEGAETEATEEGEYTLDLGENYKGSDELTGVRGNSRVSGNRRILVSTHYLLNYSLAWNLGESRVSGNYNLGCQGNLGYNLGCQGTEES